MDERAELQDLLYSAYVPATVAMRARIVLWWAERRLKKEIAVLAGVSRPTVDLWLSRYDADGIAGLLDQARGAGREQVPVSVRARILALTRTGPPAETGLSHWSSREMVKCPSRRTFGPACRARNTDLGTVPRRARATVDDLAVDEGCGPVRVRSGAGRGRPRRCAGGRRR